MSTKVAKAFCAEINELRDMLDDVPSDLANVPWRVGGWTRKQILGHLLDSAANNRQRFVRAAIDGTYAGPELRAGRMGGGARIRPPRLEDPGGVVECGARHPDGGGGANPRRADDNPLHGGQ